jgi:hypothetical protein
MKTTTHIASPRKKPGFVFSYRCPMRLIGALNEARFILREPSRTDLVTHAIEFYLRAKGIALPGDVPAEPASAARG